ncbi:Single-stranded DNA-binding protein RIM1, mitochondrial [Wickerhamiella sorbophila]|uniref:Single-stranded DNA-binding protein n=1 Tax=Wickerhamiella sorbophila TaxID=45607 RepID=A0A2T0FCM4_9ASCO|nr:Single-stranded DNA-binding protein RIM1, mitochondrial [Wickerhamiella sorbophila]PRT52731.1 Single-stranded DNA-binding protein RIM1, mitochondrial [Wickerhamiella sorbophila]
MLKTFARSFSSTSKRADLAKFTAIGRIGSDIEISTSKNNVQYVRYPLAVQTTKSETSWFNITVFDERAIDFMSQYLNRGSTVYVEADASMSNYTSTAGENRHSLQLVQSTISPIIYRNKREDVEGEANAEA